MIHQPPKHRIIMPGFGTAVLCNAFTGEVMKVIHLDNLITNAGDEYYAQLGCFEVPKINFIAGGLLLGTGTTTPTKSDTSVTTVIAGTYKTIYPGYPKTNDDDVNNTYYGYADYGTYKYFYGTTEANATGIAEGAIVNASTPTKALCHFVFDEAFDKDSKYTLTVYTNHEFLGE